MLLNIAVPHIGPLLSVLFTKLARIHDRGWTLDHPRSKKMTQEDLVELYTGPPFMLAERVAYVSGSAHT